MLKRVHGMITCKEFEDFVLSYLDGGLPAHQRSLFEWHMRICRECREYLAAYQHALAVGRAVLPSPDDPVPEDVPEDLIKAILESREH
jgi:anti-sigma factor RsiW